MRIAANSYPGLTGLVATVLSRKRLKDERLDELFFAGFPSAAVAIVRVLKMDGRVTGIANKKPALGRVNLGTIKHLSRLLAAIAHLATPRSPILGLSHD